MTNTFESRLDHIKVRIFRVATPTSPQLREAGTLVLQGHQIVAAGATPDDRLFLNYLASQPISVLIDGEMRTLTAADQPEAFLQWMHRHYSGSALRASAAEDLEEIDKIREAVSMANLLDQPEYDENRPEPAELKRARELHEAYHARFGEWAPRFGVPYTTDEEELEAIEQALRTGEQIRDQTPPGCVS